MSGKSQNAALKKWVADWADILEPDDVYWCDGSEQEYNDLCEDLVLAGTFTKLNDAKRPNSYCAHFAWLAPVVVRACINFVSGTNEGAVFNAGNVARV